MLGQASGQRKFKTGVEGKHRTGWVPTALGYRPNLVMSLDNHTEWYQEKARGRGDDIVTMGTRNGDGLGPEVGRQRADIHDQR